MRHLVLAIALMASLTACIHTPSIDGWSDDMPPKQYFSAYFKQDPKHAEYQTETNYLGWIRVYYQGNLIRPKGWLETVDEVAATQPVQHQQVVHDEMMALGKLISAEWALDDNVRLLNTRNLQAWGEAVKEAINRDELRELIVFIRNDVNALLSGEISRDDIDYERYFADDDDDFFD